MAKSTFQLKRGGELQIRPVSNFLIAKISRAARSRYAEEHGEKECPRYEVETAGGDVERYDHDEESIKDYPDQQQEWDDWLAYKNGADAASFVAMSEVYIVDGVLDEPPDDGWQERHKRRGLEIPDDPDQLKRHWLETEVLTSNQELWALVLAIQAAARDVEEAASIAADMFQHSVVGTGGEEAGGPADESGAVVDESDVGTGGGDESLGSDARPVEGTE
jgi:hypothetical protein